MAKENWGQHFSNDEKIVFEKGDWSITEDGEKTWSLYFQGQCVDPVLDYNRYQDLKGGMLLYTENRDVNSFVLLAKDKRKPVFSISGKDINAKFDETILTFHSKNEQNIKSFDTISFVEININDENQIGLDL